MYQDIQPIEEILFRYTHAMAAAWRHGLLGPSAVRGCGVPSRTSLPFACLPCMPCIGRWTEQPDARVRVYHCVLRVH